MIFLLLGFLDPINDETVCVLARCVRALPFFSSLCESLKADSLVCHLQEAWWQQSMEREEVKLVRENEGHTEKREMRENLLMAGDKRWECEETENGCGIINGYYECCGDKWIILIVWFSQLGVMDVTVKQPQSTTQMTDAGLKAHCIINPQTCLRRLKLMETVKARAALTPTVHSQASLCKWSEHVRCTYSQLVFVFIHQLHLCQDYCRKSGQVIVSQGALNVKHTQKWTWGMLWCSQRASAAGCFSLHKDYSVIKKPYFLNAICSKSSLGGSCNRPWGQNEY